MVPSRPHRSHAAGALAGVAIVCLAWVAVYGALPVDALFTAQVGPWLAYVLVGACVVGASVADRYRRRGAITPALVAGLALSIAGARTWQQLQGPYGYLPGTPFDLVLVGWPAVLAVALLAGGVERRLRAGERPHVPSDHR